MKKQITTIVATVTLIATLTIAGIAGLGNTVSANIPFEFTVNGKTLPAGNYLVTRGSAPGALTIRNAKKGMAAVAIVQGAENGKSGKASLSFRRYGNQYFWAGVSDGNSVSELPISKAERRAARGKDHLAVNETKAEIVIINATAGQ